MVGLLTAFHVLVAVILILAVLLQSARGADLAGAFGGMGSQTAFGPRGTATFLSKATVVLAVVFMLTSVTLSILSNQAGGGAAGDSVLRDEPAVPPAPGTTPAPVPGGIPQPDVQVIPEPAPSAPAPTAPPAPAPATPPAPAAPSPPAP
jgi:preprotein translocase subunit SecG